MDCPENCELLSVAHDEWVASVQFSADGTKVLSGCGNGTASLCDIRSGQREVTLRGHSDEVREAMYGNGLERRAVTVSSDTTAQVWDLRRGEELETFRGHTGEARCCSVSDETLATGEMEGSLRTWLMPL
eukprot:RCo022690